MNNSDLGRHPLPEYYYFPDAKEAAHLHAELVRELPSNHPLFGVPLEIFAADEENQDVLFRCRDNPQRFVLVHLTWIGRTEINERFPSIDFDGTYASFLEYANEVRDHIKATALLRFGQT